MLVRRRRCSGAAFVARRRRAVVPAVMAPDFFVDVGVTGLAARGRFADRMLP